MMFKNRLALFSQFLLCICLISQSAIAEDTSQKLKSENDRLLELEAILLGQLERGEDVPVEEVADNSIPQVKSVPTTKITDSDSYAERVTEQLRKENARLEREIMELNASIHSLQQALREKEDYSRQPLSWQSDSSFLTVETIKSPTVLRTSPSKNASRIYSVNAGQRLAVTHRQGGWYLVQGSGLQAWLPKEDVVEVN